ncbi:MAG: D-2-hydroxyacid dehydrogenase [Prevotellaceae bacterium]|jgi:glycerate dehydrogenase|nr:D-2-hydroxyacid dehydrogenase [Prevotellaceae bacterium]
MKIVFLDAETLGQDVDFEELEKLGTLIKYDNTSSKNVIERIKDADIAIVNKTVISAEIMQVCGKLKLVCVAATGMNNIDLDFAAKSGISVKNVAGYSTDSVVQLTYAILFSLTMRISYFDNYVKSGEYSKSGIFTHYGHVFPELAGKQIGIIGMGAIGKKSAKAGEAFGARIVYCSTSGKNNSVHYQRLELDELLAGSDVVMIHAPLNEQTRNLINADKLKLMKCSAFLINTGRGHIVNEKDLAEAIDSGKIAGAALDVFSTEPLPENNPLLHVKCPEKLVLTPHIAWTGIEARKRLLKGIVENIKEHLMTGFAKF